MKSFYQFCEEKLKEQYASSMAVGGLNAPVTGGKPVPTTITPQAMVNQAKTTSTAETAAKAAETAAKNAQSLAAKDEKDRENRLRQTLRTLQSQLMQQQSNQSQNLQQLRAIAQAAGLTTGSGSQQFTPQGTGSQPVK